MLTGKSILVTGGTGSFGHSFIPMTLEKYNPKKIVVFSQYLFLYLNLQYCHRLKLKIIQV